MASTERPSGTGHDRTSSEAVSAKASTEPHHGIASDSPVPRGTEAAPAPDCEGLERAELVARWFLGDPQWADAIVNAYLDPESYWWTRAKEESNV